MTAKELLQTASEQFLGKTSQEVQLTILQTLEGHLRAILGTLSVEEVPYSLFGNNWNSIFSDNVFDNNKEGKKVAIKGEFHPKPQKSPNGQRR